jgi:hypothetical protein
MIESYGITFACVTEIKRGILVRRLASFHVVVDVQATEKRCPPSLVLSTNGASRG